VAIKDTINAILAAETWTQRVQQIRLIPQRHGTGDHVTIYAAVARALYMPHLAPDFAYIHEAPFYEPAHFFRAYDEADRLTGGFSQVTEADLTEALVQCPGTLLVFRTLLGLTKEEFAHSSVLAGGPARLKPLSSSQIDTMERATLDTEPRRAAPAAAAREARQAAIAARTIIEVMDGRLFGEAPPGLRSKQEKPDTANGWDSVREFAAHGVPLKVFLHQRHYGGAFSQVLNATSGRRGDLI
jgi:hypothetical protein